MDSSPPQTAARAVAANTFGRYALAVVWSLLFAGIRLGLEPMLQGQAPLIVLLAAPILAAWLGGFGPGLLATVLSAVVGEMLFIPPAFTLLPHAPSEWLRLGIFVVYGAGFSWVLETHRRTMARMQAEQAGAQAAQHALAQREQRARETLEASPAGMIVVDPGGTIELVNRQAERMFRLPRERLVGMKVDELVPDSVRPGHAANRATFNAHPTSRAMGHGRDLRARRGDGTEFPVEIGLTPLTGTSAGLVLASVIDISSRKQSEDQLRLSEQRALDTSRRLEADHAVLEAILDAVPTGIVLADAQGALLRSNPAHDRIWGGWPPTRGMGEYRQWKGWWADGSARHGQPIAPDEWALSRALRDGARVEDLVEIEPFDRPGERVTLVNTSAPIRDGAGRIVGAVVAQLDVTELARAQASERESAAMFRALADNIAQLAWMTDASGAIVWYNRRWYDYTGATPEAMAGWGWQQVHHPQHVDRVVSKFRRHIATGEPWEDTFPLRGHDGEFRWFLSRAFPIRDHAGQVVSWFGTNTDVTAQRQAEEALREADRRKDDFIAVLAHELRNPLAPVRSAVEILKRTTTAADAQARRVQAIIERQVLHMARLVDDLLDVSRIGRGKLALQRERCDFAAIARDTAEDYRASLEQDMGLRLQVQVPDAPLWVDGDPVRLAQMLGNLLANAGRFNNPGGRIEVEAGQDEAGRVFAEVRDTGIGIEPGLMERLFDPFEQATQDIARSRGGLGLGLALTQGLAELHGGSVEGHSAGTGQGATFTLRLPSAQAREAAARVESPGQPARTGLRILLVEDNEDAAATLAELLQVDGHEVQTCLEAATALELARRMRPDVLVSDLGLPGAMDGYELGRRLRADPATAGLPLVALSGYADLQARRRSAEAGFDAHLPKPPDIDALERVLRGLCEAAPEASA